MNVSYPISRLQQQIPTLKRKRCALALNVDEIHPIGRFHSQIRILPLSYRRRCSPRLCALCQSGQARKASKWAQLSSARVTCGTAAHFGHDGCRQISRSSHRSNLCLELVRIIRIAFITFRRFHCFSLHVPRGTRRGTQFERHSSA